MAATLEAVADPLQRPADAYIRLREDVTTLELAKVREEAAGRLASPAVDPRGLRGLKFAVALPEELAAATLAARLADPEGAAAVLQEPVRWSARPPER